MSKLYISSEERDHIANQYSDLFNKLHDDSTAWAMYDGFDFVVQIIRAEINAIENSSQPKDAELKKYLRELRTTQYWVAKIGDRFFADYCNDHNIDTRF